jgi:hypothetical protein
MAWWDWFTASPGAPTPPLGWGGTPDPSWQNAGQNAFEAPDEFDRVRESLPADHPMYTPPAQRAGRAVDYNFAEGKGDRLDIAPSAEGFAPLSGWELEQPRTAQVAREGKRLDMPSLIERINPSLEYERDLNTTVAPKSVAPFSMTPLMPGITAMEEQEPSRDPYNLNPVVRGTVIDAEWEPMTGVRRNAPSQITRAVQGIPEALKATNFMPMLGNTAMGAAESLGRTVTGPYRAASGEIHPDDMFGEGWEFGANLGGWGGVAHGLAGAGGKTLGMNAPFKIAEEAATRPAGRQRLVASMYDPAAKRNILGDPTDTHGTLAAKNYDVFGHQDDMGFTNTVTGERFGRSDAMDWLKTNDPETYAAYGPYVNSGRLEAKKYNTAFEKTQPLTGMPLTADVPGFGTLDVGPNSAARRAAETYMKNAGMKYDPPREYAPVDPERAARVADEFERMPHAPHDPEVAASYNALINETKAQFEAMPPDLKIEFIKPGMEDPYGASPRLVQKDIAENNHMWVYPTESGFGKEGFEAIGNPMLQKSGVTVDGMELANNDLFRIVHDYFGHHKEGVGFRATGEDNAFRQHRSMFSPQAQRALTTETRGQNSWLNYGPHGAKNRTAKTADTVFADQKVGLMPEWTTMYANSKKGAPLSLAAGAANRERNIPGSQWYHGTTHDFGKFDLSKGDPEGHYGRGVYATDNPIDAGYNYASPTGGDLVAKIERLSETIMNDHPNMDNLDAVLLAEKRLLGHAEGTVKKLKIKDKGILKTDKDEFDLYDPNIYNKFSKAVHGAVDRYNDISGGYSNLDAEDLLRTVAEKGDTRVSRIDNTIRNYFIDREVTDVNGTHMEGDVLKDIYKRMGYTGVEMDAFEAFPGMVGPGTRHRTMFKRGTVRDAKSGDVLYANNEKTVPLGLVPALERAANEGGKPQISVAGSMRPEVAEKLGVSPGPIKMAAGDSRYGREHIEQRHGQQLGRYNSAADLVNDVSKNFSQVREAGNGKLMLSKPLGQRGQAAVVVRPQGSEWRVVTGGIFNEKYMSRKSRLYANSKRQAPMSLAASFENDFPFDNPNARNVGVGVDDPMRPATPGGMPLTPNAMPPGFTGSFDATANVPFTMGGRWPSEWSPEEFKQVGDAFGVNRLGPLSPEKEFPYKKGGSFSVPGGLDGKFTYYDMISMKNNPIDASRIDPDLHAKVQQKMTRSLMPDEGDVSQSHVLSGLNFGMTSPGNPLFSNQLAMSRLRINSVEDLDRLANSVPWKFGEDPVQYARRDMPDFEERVLRRHNDQAAKRKKPAAKSFADLSSANVNKAVRDIYNIEVGKKYGLGAAEADGGGGLGVRGNADYTRVAEMAQMFKKSPEWFRKRPDEQWSHFAERVFTQVPGMAAKTGSFGLVFQDPVKAAVSAIDRHMSKIFKDKFLNTPEKRRAFETRVLNLYNKKRIAKGEEPMQDISELSDSDLSYELLQELGKTKKANFRNPKGEIGKGVPEHMRDEEWIIEPKQAIAMGENYKRALQANADEASKAGLGLFESQWHLWDRIRRRLEPHENMFPGLEKLPRMSVEQLKKVDETHMQSGHKDNTKVKMDDGSVRLKPTSFMDNPADFAYFSNPSPLAPFGAIPAARRDEPQRGR